MGTTNIIDRELLKLIELYDGWGMLLYVIITLLISGILSALIGLERYRRGKDAGMRTHALLSVGCSFLMIISLWAIRVENESLSYDISRIAAGSISGIGFLGAGVIIKNKFTIRGLSTATTLWICAAIGLATGAGFVLESVVATIITLLFIFIHSRIIIKIDKNAPHVIIIAKKDYPALQKINEICDTNSLNLKNVDVIDFNEDNIVLKAFFPYHTNPFLLDYFMSELKKDNEIVEVNKILKVDKEKHLKRK